MDLIQTSAEKYAENLKS